MINNYTILTWDERTFAIDPTNAKKLIDQWTAADKPFPVNLGSEAISSSAIKSITPNYRTEADIAHHVFDTGKQLASGTKCHGSKSIQQEINMIAQGEGKRPTKDEPDSRPWNQLIRDKQWRETIRQQLHESDPDMVWCDYKIGSCACEGES